MSLIIKARFFVAIAFRILLIAAIAISLYTSDWPSLALAVLTYFLTFVPSLLAKKTRLTFPNAFELIALFFIFASIILGEMLQFYHLVWWWDVMLHGLFGVVIGLVGFSFVNQFSKKRGISNPTYIVFFSASFAISIGTIWEIFEFGMDSFFGLNMLKSGLSDTMWDLIVNSATALLVSFIAYFYLKSKSRERLI